MTLRKIMVFIGILLISYFSYIFYKDSSIDVKINNNEQLLNHLKIKYPDLRDSITLAKDRKDSSKEYLQIIFKAPDTINHKQFFRDVLLYSLHVIKQNENKLSDFSAFTMVMLKIDNSDKDNQKMIEPLSIIIGKNIIKNLENEEKFETLTHELKNTCMKTNPAKALIDYCMIRI